MRYDNPPDAKCGHDYLIFPKLYAFTVVKYGWIRFFHNPRQL